MLLRLLCLLFHMGCPKPQGPWPRPIVGVVCHRLDDTDIAALKGMGVRFVRLSLYANGDGAQWIDRAIKENFDVLAVSYRSPTDHSVDVTRWPGIQWQMGNEPDWQHLSPAQAVQAGQVSPGLAHGTPAAWINAFSAASPIGQVLALHAYGTPLAFAVRSVVALKPAGRRLWLTEIGAKVDAQQLGDALRAVDGRVVERVYVYSLFSPTDGYGLTTEQRNTIAAFVRGN